MGVTLRLVPVSEPRARTLAEDNTLLEAVLAAERGEDFDQAGLGLHFMLCGSAWGKDLPQGTLFAGGAEVGGADFGKGPARVLLPQDALSFHAYIGELSSNAFRSRHDARAMAESGIVVIDLEYLSYYFDRLKEFFRGAAESGSGVVIVWD